MKRIGFLAILLVVSVAFSVALVGAAPAIPVGSTQHQDYRSTLQTIHDVAVAGIQSSSTSVPQGQTVNIDVTLQNLGDAPEDFSLVLRDDTDARDIHTVQITLDATQTLVIGLQWDTGEATPGAHFLSADATLDNDQNPSNDTLSLPGPVHVEGVRITFDLLAPPKATFGEGMVMAQPSLTTQASSLSSVFLGVHDASNAGPLVRAAVATQATPRQSIFVANADATFQPSNPLQDPFQQGEIQGLVRLEGNQSSLGSYIQVGPDIHFVQPDGSFRVMAPGGTFDIFLAAPGHVPVHIPNTPINPGEVLNLPELTLPFGDANGDGKIDILDLSIAASNFGETVIQVPPP